MSHQRSAINSPVIVSSSGKVYSPLSRPSTASSGGCFWRPASAKPSVVVKDSEDIKKVPKNQKYENVQAKIETGPNVMRIEGNTAARYRRTESFKRIRASKLAQVLSRPEGQDNILILDLRDKAEFNDLRIKGALHYPSSMMSRSMYQFTPEILTFKNVQGKQIVLYDMDEKLSLFVGTNWFEKGIDNFVILSGGLATFAKEFPELLHPDENCHFATSDECSVSKSSIASTTRSVHTSMAAGRSTLKTSSSCVSTVLRRAQQCGPEGGKVESSARISRNPSIESRASLPSRPSSAHSKASQHSRPYVQRVPLQQIDQPNTAFWLAQDKMYRN